MLSNGVLKEVERWSQKGLRGPLYQKLGCDSPTRVFDISYASIFLVQPTPPPVGHYDVQDTQQEVVHKGLLAGYK